MPISVYKEEVETYGFGYSELAIDAPGLFTPSSTFLRDFEYIDGAFYLYIQGFFDSNPERALLIIKYDQEVYESAKTCMLENFEPFGNKFYVYNGYYFYDNNDYLYKQSLSSDFTAACYNDEKQVLCFLGFCDVYHYDFHEKYEYGKEEKWPEFIDQYYGEWYDFSK